MGLSVPPLALRSHLSRRMAGFVLGLCLFGAAPVSASVCPDPLRVTVLDFDESTRKPQGVGMTALQTAVARSIAEVAEVPAVINAYPYARALKTFREGDAHLVLIAEGAGRQAVPNAERVPMMRLLFVRMEEKDRVVLPAASEVGTLIGFVPPPGAIADGESVQRVSNYSALLRLLFGGRVKAILGARPSIDSYLVDHPALQARLGRTKVVGEQAMAAHLSPRLDANCRERLANAAREVRATRMRAIFERTAPGVDPAPFIYRETEPTAPR